MIRNWRLATGIKDVRLHVGIWRNRPVIRGPLHVWQFQADALEALGGAAIEHTCDRAASRLAYESPRTRLAFRDSVDAEVDCRHYRPGREPPTKMGSTVGVTSTTDTS